MILGIAHLAFMVSDMEKSLDFYCRGLGIRHAFAIPDTHGNPWIEYLKVTDNQFIELFYPKGEYSAKNSSYMHLCLQVADCRAAAEELEARGLTVWAPPSQGLDHNWQCWISDPDGHPIEIMQISPNSPQANA